jgi:hypothetical protein
MGEDGVGSPLFNRVRVNHKPMGRAERNHMVCMHTIIQFPFRLAFR